MDSDPLWITGGFILQGVFGGSIYGQNPSYLSERFPTEVRATASGFVYHQGAILGGLVAPVLTYIAVQMNMGFALPMMFSTMVFWVVIVAVLLGPETKGKKLTADSRSSRCYGCPLMDGSPAGAPAALSAPGAAISSSHSGRSTRTWVRRRQT